MQNKVWWNPKEVTYEDATAHGHAFRLELQERLKQKFPKHFLDTFVDVGVAKTHVRNYDVVMAKIRQLFDTPLPTDKMSPKVKTYLISQFGHSDPTFDQFTSVLNLKTAFWDLFLIGGQGDLDGIIDATDQATFEKGEILYERYFAAGDILVEWNENVIEYQLASENIAEYLFAKMGQMKQALSQILSEVEFTDRNLQEHVIIEILFESPNEILWHRILCPKGEGGHFIIVSSDEYLRKLKNFKISDYYK